MRDIGKIIVLFISVLMLSVFSSCGDIAPMNEIRLLDSLNQQAYDYRYKNLDSVLYYAHKAYTSANLYKLGKAEASNNLGFYAFMKMDFERAEQLHKEVYSTTSNELECLIADIGLMKIYQRTSMNKEFYDYRNSAINRMKRINEDVSVFADRHEKQRLNYAISEFYIVSAIYYYYLQQKPEAVTAINLLKEELIINDTAQWLYYRYIKGAAGLCDADEYDSQIVCEFDNLYSSLRIARQHNYIYFEANSLQGIAELLITQTATDVLYDRRSQALRRLNSERVADSLLPFQLARQALSKFKQYDDIYQIAGSYRTIGTWLNERGHYREAVDTLNKALGNVNRHHQLYYKCNDEHDRLKSFDTNDTIFVDLKWINDEGIKTVPEWVARIREQLSVAYSGLGDKKASDYNRNIYLDILDVTRQDKELESRYQALEKESKELSALIYLVIIGVILLILFFGFYNSRWEKRNKEDIERLKQILEISQKITAAIPADGKDTNEIIEPIISSILPELQKILPVSSMNISLLNKDTEEVEDYQEDNTDEEDNKSELVTYSSEFQMLVPNEEQPIGIIKIHTLRRLSKDEYALFEVLVPYITWVIVNGITFISLGDERRRLEKELYVFEQHIIENKRQNLIKRACMSIVVGINPFIDRIINEIAKLKGKEYARDQLVKKEKYLYIDELITKINEYNDILSLWIKMKQGTLSLNIENFPVNELFEVILKGRKTFEMKNQTLSVEPTNAIVKADKALTLFMINTLAENARKYTPEEGNISLYAVEYDDYIEISVKDDGIGLSAEDVSQILDEKIYDSSRIGMTSGGDLEELSKNKGSGYGLMNCKGIIEKYKKTSDVFKVCLFSIDSELGKGSRFYFRLPKGVRKFIVTLVGLIFSFGLHSCHKSYATIENDNLSLKDDSVNTVPFDEELFNDLLTEASLFADSAYYCNINGEYQSAIYYIDSSLMRLNEHYELFSSNPCCIMELVGNSSPVEIEWWNSKFDSDYHIILDIRNEASVAFLALKDWESYRYNNEAYTALYKLLGEDTSLAEYCRQLEHSTNNKIVGIILCIVLLLIFLVSYYIIYIRRRHLNRRNLEQVLEINRDIFLASLMNATDSESTLYIPYRLIDYIFDAVDELLIIDIMGIAIFNEDNRKLEFVFNTEQFEEYDGLTELMRKSFENEEHLISPEGRWHCYPLIVDVGETHRCIGVFAYIKQMDNNHESDHILSGLIARFIAIVMFNVVVKMATKYRDIEFTQDETRRASREEGIIHVQNMVLDNCLSTIKHETIYYPSKIKQIIDKLNQTQLATKEESESINTISDLISYYKDIYMILSSCASRQLEEVTFKRNIIDVQELMDYARKYFTRLSKKLQYNVKLITKDSDLRITGDIILLKFLIENLINESLSFDEEGLIEFEALIDDGFVRFFYTDRRREKTIEELNSLFYPSLSRMNTNDSGKLYGTEYLNCKQIIRDHDEFAGRRGCRINAEPAPDGGFTVYFTIPLRK